jgi:hypothetical protein
MGKEYSTRFPGQREMIFYEAPWSEGNLAGTTEKVLSLPFSFPLALGYFGSAFEFTPDLSTIVYVPAAGQADLYFISAKF